MLKGAIFDLDGTLLDSMQMWNNFAEKYLEILLKETHSPLSAEENLSGIFRTFTMEQAAAYYQTHYGIGLSAEEIIFGENCMTACLKNTIFAKSKTARDDGFLVAAVMDSSEIRQNELRLLSDCFIEDFEHTRQFCDFFCQHNIKA